MCSKEYKMINTVKPYKDDMIIPLTVSCFGDDVSIDVYEEYVEIAREYEASFRDDYFSDAALEFLNSRISPEGYVRYDDIREYLCVYMMEDICELCDSNITATDIYDAEYEVDETEFEADVIKENGEPASVIIDNGRIASIAAANFFVEDDDEVELAVETLPEYRGRGYAKAVLCDMVKKVFAMGKYPSYRVSCFNNSSIRTVEACGFKAVGREYYMNFYKEEE